MNDDTTQRGGAAACSILAILMFACAGGWLILAMLVR